MHEHQSTHAIGTVLQLRRKRERLTATLHTRYPNGEEWRITDRRGRYCYSEGWRFVREHQELQTVADFAAALDVEGARPLVPVPFALTAETPATEEQQPELFGDEKP